MVIWKFSCDVECVQRLIVLELGRYNTGTPPSGILDLVNWNIPIMAMDSYYDYKTRSAKTVLSDIIIAELLSILRQGSKLIRFLTKL